MRAASIARRAASIPASCCHWSRQHYLLLQRNLLYTAITRARRLCVIVGDLRALRRAVQNDALKRRNTALAERLRGPALRTLDEPDRPAFPAIE